MMEQNYKANGREEKQ